MTATKTSNIVSIVQGGGLAHLMDEATPKTKPQPKTPDQPDMSDKCLKVRVILDAAEYYTTLDGFGQNSQPPFQFVMPLGYSALRDATGQLLSIHKHEAMQIYATGVRTEAVDLPSWWGERDKAF